MTGQQFVQLAQEGVFSMSLSLDYNGRLEAVDSRELSEVNTSPQALRDYIERKRPDRVVVNFFVEEDGADAQVKDALEFMADKMDFKGDVVPSRKPASNNKNYYFVSSEPRTPVFGDGWASDE